MEARMTRTTDLRTQYQVMLEAVPEQVKQLYQGVLMGIDLAAGAAAMDYADKLEAELERAQSELANRPQEPAWRKPAGPKRQTRNPDLTVTCYALTDPRLKGEPPFYVGSAQDPEAQLDDYIKAEVVKVSAKPVIDEIVAEGQRPGIDILETGVRATEAIARKNYWIEQLTDLGEKLVNQRRSDNGSGE